LRNRDIELARLIIVEDIEINRRRYETEEKCIDLLAMQQPLARDLRTIVAILYIITDLERMGDHAEGIAKVSIMLADEPPLKPYIDIPRMAEKAIAMLRKAIEAFKHRNVELARFTWTRYTVSCSFTCSTTPRRSSARLTSPGSRTTWNVLPTA
jgi:phosphate transport system protein